MLAKYPRLRSQAGLSLLATALLGCSAPPDPAAAIPAPAREFRAAWVATVANIDWPSQPGLDTARQQQEARAILDRLVELRMNAVVFQVRPHADALYASELEPWSNYLSGVQGQPPRPFYDPLEFWITEAHARGLQLHAWFNPYRANHPSHRGALSETSICVRRPELVVKLGSKGYRWMDPALAEVQDHTVAVVLDVLRRYDVDGIHFDDYFYPYASYNDGRDFPDDHSFYEYQKSGGSLGRKDWRRQAVNTLIQRLHREIKAHKPHVAFGISPFGIWRPGHPPSISGMDQYDQLFADARLWWNRGWVDYLSPQLYWPIAQLKQSFPVLLAWWAGENQQQRHLWPGTSLRRPGTEQGKTELLNQIQITRAMLPDSPGICVFSMKRLMGEDPLVPALQKGPYRNPALVPASPWQDKSPPARPELELEIRNADGAIHARLPGAERPAHWIVYQRRKGHWSHQLLPGKSTSLEIPLAGDVEAYAVSAVDRSGNEGPRAWLDLSPGRD